MRGITSVGYRSLLVLVIWVASAWWPAQAGKIWWPSITGDLGFTSEVRRAELDGSNVEQLYEEFNDGGVFGIALDLSADKMYFTRRNIDTGGGSILRADLNGCALETAFSMTSGIPGQLALDVDAGKIYWSQWGALPRIRRANLDGGLRHAHLRG